MDYAHTHDKNLIKNETNLAFDFEIEWPRVTVSFEILAWWKFENINVLKTFWNTGTIPALHRHYTGTTPALHRHYIDHTMKHTDSWVPSTKGAKSTISLKPTSQASFILTCVGIPDFNTNEHVSSFGSIHEFSRFYENLEFDKCFDQVFD